MHPLLHPAGCIVPCIIVRQISQLSTQVLIQYLGTIFFGSLSNVGVCPRSEQNPCPKGREASEAEGEAFEGFNGVIAALSKTVGQANVECVQDVRPPVDEHFAEGLNSRRFSRSQASSQKSSRRSASSRLGASMKS